MKSKDINDRQIEMKNENKELYLPLLLLGVSLSLV